MRNLVALALSIPLLGCVVGGEDVDVQGGGSGGGGGNGTGGGGGGGNGTGVSGNITQSTEWSGAVIIGGITTIDPGVTVTVAAGTTITVKSVGQLVIGGILDAQGTSASKIEIKPETGNFQGVTVSPGGELKYKYVTQTGGGIYLSGTAKATIVDSAMSRTSGDFLMMNGGTLDVSYSSVGVEPGQNDTTHCNLHFGGSGNVIKVTHTNISTAPYGLMFYGGMNADFTYNNWFENTVDVDTTQTSPVTGDFSNGWFQKGAPTGTGITANTPAGARLTACDGNNNTTCAGPRP